MAEAYIQQSMEFRFSASKEAGDWLSERLAEQRKAVEASEAALQEFKERNGAVSIADGASNIAMQRLTDLNAALTKAKTERINKEALYNQLKSAQRHRRARHLPAVLANEYIQKLKSEPGDRAAAAGAARGALRRTHAEMIKARVAVQSAEPS